MAEPPSNTAVGNDQYQYQCGTYGECLWPIDPQGSNTGGKPIAARTRSIRLSAADTPEVPVDDRTEDVRGTSSRP